MYDALWSIAKHDFILLFYFDLWLVNLPSPQRTPLRNKGLIRPYWVKPTAIYFEVIQKQNQGELVSFKRIPMYTFHL